MNVNDPFDLFLRVNDFAKSTPWLHTPVTDWAKYGIVVFAGILLLGWWIARRGDSRTMAAALLAPISTIVAVTLNQPIIRAVNEARPYVVHPQALVLVTKSADPSFPSDHAAMAGAVSAGVWLVSWRLGLVAAVLALLMAAARVYVGAHYPVDVLAGLVFGATVSLLCWLLLRVPMTKLVVWLRSGPVAPLLGPPAAASVAR